ncbi:Pyrimidine deaminase [Burkholderia singularis]|uniref:Pyrimidine deaminase n=1 Tax=Burkholderia singularis TaxID=1503053 RepID=A0A238HA55_9BURK|nr:Pyrimidine deaminase [Burkholderia singularis]
MFFASSWLARKIRQVQTRGGSFPGNARAPFPGGFDGPGTASGGAAGGDYFCSPEHAARHAAHANRRGRS